MRLLESKRVAWCAMILIVALMIIAMCLRIVGSIWEYSILFFAFMAVFCHLASLILSSMSKNAARKLDVGAAVFGVLTVIDVIVIFILNFISFY